MVFRNELDSAFRALDETEARAFTTLQNQGSIAELCEVLCDSLEEETIPSYVLSSLHQWLSEELIIGIS